MPNIAPTLSALTQYVFVGEEAANLTPQLLDIDIYLVDPEQNFNGGSLALGGLTQTDQVGIRHQGVGVGQIGVSGNSISYGGIVIGSFTGGGVGETLVVSFNAAAHAAAIEAVIENLTYMSLSDNQQVANLTLVVTDAAGAPAVAPMPTPLADPLTGITIASGYSAPSFGDVDGDGDLDLVVGNFAGTLSYYRNDGGIFNNQTGTYNPLDGSGNPFGSITSTAFAIGGGAYSTPSLADLDGDGDLDLAMGAFGGKVRYFLNTDTSLDHSEPFYAEQTDTANPFNAVNFGAFSYSAPSFADLDGDGDLDAVIGDDYSLHYFQNTGTNLAPAFTELSGTANPFAAVNNQISTTGSAAFLDLDGDGDLDAVAGDEYGTVNILVNTGTSTAPSFGVIEGYDGGEGGTPQPGNPFNGVDVGVWGVATVADLDGSGLPEIVLGAQDGILHYFPNANQNADPNVSVYAEQAGAASPFNGISLPVGSYGNGAAPVFVNLDGDGDLDLVVGDYDGAVHYYLNTGSAAAPVYVEQTGGANPFLGVNVAYYAAPAFADLDLDGDLDMAVGGYQGAMDYYRNDAGVFTLQSGAGSDPFAGISLSPYSSLAPTFGDLDGDGDMDAVVGQGSSLVHLINTNDALTPPGTLAVFADGGEGGIGSLSVNSDARPSLIDFNGDGDLDLVVGNRYGSLQYFENTGSSTAFNFVERIDGANPLGSISVSAGYSSPALVNLDGDPELEVVVGAGDSMLHAFDSTSAVRIVVGIAQYYNPTSGDDVMHGPFDSNIILNGQAGNDTMFAHGNATLYGNTGNDSLNGGEAGGFMPGGATLIGGEGNDTLNGGDNDPFNQDQAFYSSYNDSAISYPGSPGITANLVDGSGTVLDGHGGTDTLIDIDGIVATNFADTVNLSGTRWMQVFLAGGNDSFVGSDGGIWVSAGDGDDVLTGGNGNDEMQGGAGTETISGGAGDDRLQGDELNWYNAEYTTIVAGNDSLSGGDGNDLLKADRGDDTLNGGAGIDTADFEHAMSGISVVLDDFGAATVVDSALNGLGTDTLIDIENLAGTRFADTLTGNIHDNFIDGRGAETGVDTLDGGDGFDTVSFQFQQAVTIQLGSPNLLNFEAVQGSQQGDSLTGDANDNSFEGMGGSDSIDGGAGIDTVSYASSQSGVVVQLDAGGNALSGYTGRASNDGWEYWTGAGYAFGDDALRNIDNATGSNFADILRGDVNNNVLSGLDGNDTMSGDLGNDTYIGGAGFDLLQFSDYLANNTITRSGDGSYTLVGPEGTDTLIGIEQVQFYGTGNYNGGTLNLTGNTIDYEGLGNGAAVNFNPLVDILNVNDPGMVATNFRFGLSGDQQGVFLEQLDPVSRSVVKTVTLVFTPGVPDGTNPYKIAADMVRFASGSLLIVGDGTSGTVADDLGSDIHDGSATSDLMVSFGASNTLNGGDGDDVLVTIGAAGGQLGGSGTDVFNGGAGNDTLALESVQGLVGYTVDLSNLAVGAQAISAGANSSSFTLSGIENVEGSDGNDIITGDANANRLVGIDGADSLSGGGGNDTLVGGNGADTLIGGANVDTLDYSGDANADGNALGVVVNLSGASQTNSWQGVNFGPVASQRAVDGWGNTDNLGSAFDIENVIGSAYNDWIIGNGQGNSLNGGAGSDLLNGLTGNDTLDGGTVGDSIDTDWAGFSATTVAAGVIVNLGTGIAIDSIDTDTVTGGIQSGTDTLINIDGVFGSNFGDTLTGGSDSTDFRGIKTEWFQGGAGNDRIDGGWVDLNSNGVMDADDYEYNWARYDGSSTAVTANLATGIVTVGAGGNQVGEDTLVGGINALWGGFGNDTLTGGNAVSDYRELFNGGSGDDSIIGGSGFDVALYRNSNAGISVSLTSGNGGGSDGMGYTDFLWDVEAIVGSNHNDTITGGAGNQMFQGRQGDDSLTGGDDIDTVSYDGDYDSNGDGFGVAVNLSAGALGGGTSWQGFSIGALGADRALDGWGGTDILASFENITGSIYNDYLVGSSGVNVIDAGRGNDLVFGGDGNDTLDGGDGNDTLSYRSTGSGDLIYGVMVDLGAGTATDTFGNIDMVTNFETVVGSAYADSLTGDPGVFSQFLSSDRTQVFEGREGADTIDGGTSAPSSFALASYSSSTGPIQVNLAQGWASDGFGAGTSQDQLRNIDGIIGSAGNDSITGGSRSAFIVSSNLFEQFDGGLGNDTIDGGSGTDRVSYAGANGSVTVTLGEGFMAGMATGAAGNDVLINIEQIRGSNFNDVLTGNSGNNAFEGRGGNDMIHGGAGFDTIRFDQSASAVQVMFSNDVAGEGGAYDGGFAGIGGGVDMFTGIESVRGSEFNDSMQGGIGNETFEGMAGDDFIDGGAGSDTISYASSLSGVGVALFGGSGGGIDHWGGTDSFYNIENVTGSHFDDYLAGDGGNNLLQGQGGNDTLTGGLGNDTINGGFGFDTAHFSGDILSYTITDNGGGNFTVAGADGTDTVSGVEQFTFDVGGPQLNAITYYWSQLPDGAAFDFDPTVDFLVFDAGLSATDIDFTPIEDGPDVGRGVQFTQWNEFTGQPAKQISLLFTPGDNPANMFKLSSSHFSFANGSFLKLGDDTTGINDDNVNTALNGGAGNDVLVSIGGSDTLNGGAGDDFLVTVQRQSTPGSSGTDVFIGGDGNDWLGLDADPMGGTIVQYTVDLAGTGSITHDALNTGFNSSFTVSGIENVEGSDVADHITGDAGNNQLVGWDGNDTLLGGAGNDSLTGGQGSDYIDGGTGRDRIDYSQDSNGSGVSVDLVAGTATMGSDTDTILNVEHIVGTHSADTLTGNDAQLLSFTLADTPTTFEGLSGYDTIDGGSNAPSSFVFVSYAAAHGPVNVNLATGTAADGMGGTDTLSNIDGIIGSSFNDVLTGGGDSSVMLSTLLFESFEGGMGNDTIDGGSGADRVSYENNMGSVTVTLDTDQNGGNGFNGTAVETGGMMGNTTDTLINIEQIRGSMFADSLTGSSANNGIEGMGGHDTINGGFGFDQARYSRSTGAINATFTSNGSGTVLDGFGGTDTLINIEEIYASDFADTLTGGSGNDSFIGMMGNDTIDGGTGYDRASYVFGPVGAGVTVTMSGALGAGTATDQWGTNDTLTGIESIQGSHFADTLTGNAANINPYLRTYQAETFEGMGGNDTIDGGTNAPTHFAQVTYVNSPGAVSVNLGALTNHATDPWGNTDTLLNIDSVIGTNFADTLTGGSTSSQIIATGYFENFEGLGGNDTINGGMGTDRVTYNGGAVNVNFTTNLASDGYGGTDTLISIEQVRASMSADVLTGNGGNNAFEGRGGDDAIDGGLGFDTIRYDGSIAPVTVTFSNSIIGSGTATDGGFVGVAVGTDTFSNIEAVRGSDYNDTMLGGIGDQTFEGMAGDDSMDGGLGNDRVSYSSNLSAVTVTLSSGAATVIDHWLGTDSISNIENITGSQFNDTLTGDAFDNFLQGLSGNDTLTGGQGKDTAQFSGLKSEYTVLRDPGGFYTVTDNNAANGDDGVDTLYGIETIQFADGLVNLGKKPLGNDYNGDGKSDIFWRNAASGENYIFHMDGANIIGGGALATVPTAWVVAGTGDYNGDSKNDILWRNGTTGENYIFQMDGANIIGGGALATVPTAWTVADAKGDYNGDGKSDIFWRNAASGENYIFQMDGANIIGGGALATVPTAWVVAGTGDYNGDSKNDILWRNGTTGENYIFQMDGANIIGGGALATVPTAWTVADAKGDYNGDGKSDIFWRNAASGENYIFQMDGANIIGGGALATVPAAWMIV